MTTIDNVRFLIDDAGNKVAAVLDLETYEQIVQRLEDLEDAEAAREYDAREAAGQLTLEEQQGVPLEQAFAEIEAEWSKRDAQSAEH